MRWIQTAGRVSSSTLGLFVPSDLLTGVKLGARIGWRQEGSGFKIRLALTELGFALLWPSLWSSCLRTLKGGQIWWTFGIVSFRDTCPVWLHACFGLTSFVHTFPSLEASLTLRMVMSVQLAPELAPGWHWAFITGTMVCFSKGCHACHDDDKEWLCSPFKEVWRLLPI